MNSVAIKYEPLFIQAARRIFDTQELEVIRRLKDANKKSVSKQDVKEVFDAAAAEALALALADGYNAVITEAGAMAIALVSVAEVFDPADPAVAAFISERASKVAQGVNEETDKQLKASLMEGISEGESMAQLLDRVREVFGAAAGYRAERIARTETIRASTFASVQAWDKSGLVERKEWFTAKDQRVCPFCNAMDGQLIGLKDNFFEEGDVFEIEGGRTIKLDYEPVQGPPLHVLCRCVLLPA